MAKSLLCQGGFGDIRLALRIGSNNLIIAKSCENARFESALLSKLSKGCPKHFPQCYGHIDDDTFLMEYLGLYHPSPGATYSFSNGTTVPLPDITTLYSLIVLNPTDSSVWPYVSSCDISRILQGVMEGLMYMHSHQLLHNDMKPENICIAMEDGRLRGKIIDIGNITDSRRRTRCPLREDESASSFSHIAPEILDGDNHSPYSDGYSMGFVCLCTTDMDICPPCVYQVYRMLYTRKPERKCLYRAFVVFRDYNEGKMLL